MLLCTGLASPALAEGYLTTGVAVGLKPGQLTLIAKPGIVGTVPLPRALQVFVFQRIPIGDAQPGDTIATTGVVVNGATTPTLDAGEIYLVHQPVPDAARRALVQRFLPPQPTERIPPGLDLGISFATWSGLVSRTTEGGVEFKRADGTLALVRPNSDQIVGQLRPGTLDDLKTGRLRLFGVGEKVTAIVVDVPIPVIPGH